MKNNRVSDSYPIHLRQRINEILAKPISAPPSPWKALLLPIVGGLVEVGFSESSEYLLAITHDGRGLFDCSTGEKIARDYSPLDGSAAWHDSTRLRAKGIGPVSEEWIPLSGLWGGGLRKDTNDGWFVKSYALDWPNEHLILENIQGHVALDTRFPFDATVLGIESEVRAFGFSWSGRNLVLATSDTLWMWRKQV
ncbi:MAG: hypothetical protein FWC50_08875 [Planctomycetaceae bacterium]|nr:hypothetical protein [Planctomycetaceae bacterium]